MKDEARPSQDATKNTTKHTHAFSDFVSAVFQVFEYDHPEHEGFFEQWMSKIAAIVDHEAEKQSLMKLLGLELPPQGAASHQASSVNELGLGFIRQALLATHEAVSEAIGPHKTDKLIHECLQSVQDDKNFTKSEIANWLE